MLKQKKRRSSTAAELQQPGTAPYLLRNFPVELKHALKVEAARRGIPMATLIYSLIRGELARVNASTPAKNAET